MNKNLSEDAYTNMTEKNGLQLTFKDPRVYTLEGVKGGDSIAVVEVIVSNMCSPVQGKYHELIFEKFKQVPHEHEKKRGKGIGLAFCKMVVEAHGGRICIESPVAGGENGVAIHFTLPL